MLKHFTFVSLFAVFCSAPQKKTKIIFFGDSLTELAVKPNGFITRIDSLAKISAAGKFEFFGSGFSGNKVYDLYLRLEKDVIQKKPNVVVILVGINDIWHKRLFGTGTDPDKFEQFYQSIIDRLKAKSIKIILCTPTVIGEKKDHSNDLDGDLDKYSQVVRDLAKRNKLALADLRKDFAEYLRTNNPGNRESGILTYDKVHLSDRGNWLVAEKLWKLIRELRK